MYFRASRKTLFQFIVLEVIPKIPYEWRDLYVFYSINLKNKRKPRLFLLDAHICRIPIPEKCIHAFLRKLAFKNVFYAYFAQLPNVRNVFCI